jgi:hypothetical protein
VSTQNRTGAHVHDRLRNRPRSRFQPSTEGPGSYSRAVIYTCQGSEWVHEIKHDGYRLIVRRDGAMVRLWTRKAQLGRGVSVRVRRPLLDRKAALASLLDGSNAGILFNPGFSKARNVAA